jgi:hypothetical protein
VAEQRPEGAPEQPGEGAGGALGRVEQGERAALGVAHAVAGAEPEDGREGVELPEPVLSADERRERERQERERRIRFGER